MTIASIATRKRLLRLVEAFPGLHLREIARQTELSEALAGYHLDALVDDGHVSAVSEGGFRRFYAEKARGPSDADRELVALLRQPALLQIVVFLLEHPGASHGDVTAQLGLAKGTVSYHLAKLQAGDVVVPHPDGRGLEVREPRRVERLLLRWEPPRDVTDRFGALWSAFYAHRRRRGP